MKQQLTGQEFRSYFTRQRLLLLAGLGVVLVLGAYLHAVGGDGGGLIVSCICVIYPAYKSFLAINSKDKNDDTQWLTYWTVYASFGIIESILTPILDMTGNQFCLRPIRCIFMIWCMLPMTNNGSDIIYHGLIQPFVKKNEKGFDSALRKMGDVAKDVKKHAVSAAKEVAHKVDVNKAMEFTAKVEELTAEDASKKED